MQLGLAAQKFYKPIALITMNCEKLEQTFANNYTDIPTPLFLIELNL
jgi:hypothetical protein